MTFYDAKGKAQTARPGQVLPTGTMFLEGGKWRTLTAPETVRKVIIEGNPYDQEDDSFVLVPMTDSAWTARNAPLAPPVPKAGTYEAALVQARAEVAARGAAPEGQRWVINPTVFPKAGDFFYQDKRDGKVGLRIETKAIPAAKEVVTPAGGTSYREQGDPRYPGKYDGQKAAREWAEDAYRSGDSWSDD